MERIDAYIEQQRGRYEGELAEFLCIPSISALPEHCDDTIRAADHVARLLTDAGAEVTVHQTAGHRIVYGQRCDEPDAPTLLFYGHYDVQPVDPLDEWISPPFEPTVRNGEIFARGATDDKGQMFAHIKALEAWRRTAGRVPLNVKYLFEGEEEIGSEQLWAFVPEHRDLLDADYVVVSDSEQFAECVPAITCGLRGIVCFEVTLRGPSQDLHSGTFGGAVANSANVAAMLAASLTDGQGRITLDGFYSDVVEPTAEERDAWAALPFDAEAFREALGAPALAGEQGYSPLEQRWVRPTCDVNGIHGGYAGEGAKTIVPARASFKVSFRLVPNQDPQQVTAAFQKHVHALCPPGVRCRIESFHGSPAVLAATDSPGMRAARRAVTIGFGAEPVLTRMGGSIPIIGRFQDVLGADPLMIGFGLPDDNAHSPNEKFRLADLHRGIRTSAHLMNEVAREMDAS
jgi:acetylornithine deacetylase/succinyl-diaminopimelate desuccinylase-like protein